MLLLPSLLTAPLDSPELVRITPRPEPKKQPALLCWSVPVVCFDASAALDVLDEPAEHARYGASVQFLAEAAAFARGTSRPPCASTRTMGASATARRSRRGSCAPSRVRTCCAG